MTRNAHVPTVHPSSTSFTSAHDPARLRGLLADRGLRVTRQRLAVLAVLAHHAHPASLAQIATGLDDVDRATVYRTLQTLADSGVIVRAQLADRVARFHLPPAGGGDHQSHAHFVCTACGAVRCLGADDVLLRPQALEGAVDEVQLRGRCGRCVSLR